jgi:succinate dehydrogenase hydrophobic anchor subunit
MMHFGPVVMNRMPFVSFYAKIKGWPYVIAWCHRIAGLFLVAYLWFHIYTLLSLSSPPLYNATMKIYRYTLFTILEWGLALPVIFHALNGGRLILYESFSSRNDESMIRWVLGLSILYMVLLGVLMLIGTQGVSPVFYWLTMLLTSSPLAYGVASKVWEIRHSRLWKLQRISGAFLLIMVPAHLLFMHLNPSVGKEANIVIMRMQHWFIKSVDLGLVVVALYHAGYGVISLLRDYVSFRILRKTLAALIVLVILIFAWAGLRLTLTI